MKKTIIIFTILMILTSLFSGCAGGSVLTDYSDCRGMAIDFSVGTPLENNLAKIIIKNKISLEGLNEHNAVKIADIALKGYLGWNAEKNRKYAIAEKYENGFTVIKYIGDDYLDGDIAVLISNAGDEIKFCPTASDYFKLKNS